MKNVPTTWDETILIDGYPGKFCVLARRHADTWYIAAINAEKTVKNITVNLPMLAGNDVAVYADKDDRSPQITKQRLNKTKQLKIKLLPDGGSIIVGK